MSNRYKQYFNNISPDKKLTEETAQKMLEELNSTNVKKFNIKPFAAAAACFAVTVSAVILAPDMKKDIQINDQAQTSRGAVELPVETVPVTTAETDNGILNTEITTVIQLTEDTSKKTDETTVSAYAPSESLTAASGNITEGESSTTTLVSKNPHQNIVSSVSSSVSSAPVSLQTSKTEKTIITHISSSVAEEILTSSAASVPEETQMTEETSSVLPTDLAVTSVSRPVVRPGVTNNSSAEAAVTTISDFDNNNEEDFYYSVSAGEYTLKINYAYDYSYVYPGSAQKIDKETVSQILGKEFMPSYTDNLYPDTSGVCFKNDRSYKNGFLFTFGEETELDRTTGRFISMAVGNSTLHTGYDFSFINPSETVIGDKSIIFGTAGGFSDVYFCSFADNDIVYRFLFKGYTPEEMINILKTV